jgi:hypothetical protein
MAAWVPAVTAAPLAKLNPAIPVISQVPGVSDIPVELIAWVVLEFVKVGPEPEAT